MGFELVAGFIDHFYTQPVTTSNYSAIAISTTHKSTQHPLSFFQPAVFTSRSLATDSNTGDSSASRAQVLSSQPPYRTAYPD
jgi:hypothetical protein